MESNADRPVNTPEEEQLIRMGWKPRGHSLWIHPLFDRTNNYNYHTTTQAVDYMTSNSELFEVYNTIKDNDVEIERLRHLLETERAFYATLNCVGIVVISAVLFWTYFT